jgi:hypothetical protein
LLASLLQRDTLSIAYSYLSDSIYSGESSGDLCLIPNGRRAQASGQDTATAVEHVVLSTSSVVLGSRDMRKGVLPNVAAIAPAVWGVACLPVVRVMCAIIYESAVLDRRFSPCLLG